MARILVLDDSPIVAAQLRATLGSSGHDVRGVPSLAYIPAVLRSHQPDLVLLDLTQPRLPARTVADMVRRYQLRATPMVVLGSGDRDALAKAARRMGAVGSVVRDAAPEEIRAVVNGALPRVPLTGPAGEAQTPATAPTQTAPPRTAPTQTAPPRTAPTQTAPPRTAPTQTAPPAPRPPELPVAAPSRAVTAPARIIPPADE
jgi:DNA-binding response OmpR family regulator